MSFFRWPFVPGVTAWVVTGGLMMSGCDSGHCEKVERIALDLDEAYAGGPSAQEVLAAVVGDYEETLRWNQVHAHMPSEYTTVQATVRSISDGGAWYVQEARSGEGEDSTCGDPRIEVEVSINLESEDEGLGEWFIGVAMEAVGQDDVAPVMVVNPRPDDITGDLGGRMTKDLRTLWLLMSVDDEGNLVGDLEASRMYDSPVGVGAELVPLAIWGPNPENDPRFADD